MKKCADFGVHALSPYRFPYQNPPLGRIAAGIQRFGQLANKQGLGPARLPLRAAHAVLDVAVARLLLGAELPGSCRIGKGIVLPHGGRGVVLHPTAVIGDDVIIFHQVTLGWNVEVKSGACIFPGAKVLEAVTIGRNSQVGANAVVTRDVPDDTVVAGVPARVIGARKVADIRSAAPVKP